MCYNLVNCVKPTHQNRDGFQAPQGGGAAGALHQGLYESKGPVNIKVQNSNEQ